MKCGFVYDDLTLKTLVYAQRVITLNALYVIWFNAHTLDYPARCVVLNLVRTVLICPSEQILTHDAVVSCNR